MRPDSIPRRVTSSSDVAVSVQSPPTERTHSQAQTGCPRRLAYAVELDLSTILEPDVEEMQDDECFAHIMTELRIAQDMLSHIMLSTEKLSKLKELADHEEDKEEIDLLCKRMNTQYATLKNAHYGIIKQLTVSRSEGDVMMHFPNVKKIYNNYLRPALWGAINIILVVNHYMRMDTA